MDESSSDSRVRDLVVEIDQGKLRGKTKTDYRGDVFYSFQGIPYAKPPVGELRFKAPQPPEPWVGIRDCTTEQSESLSRHVIFQFEIGSEFCLYLNVYTKKLPDEDAGNLKPVMFWIHGGAFVSGSSKTDICGPEYLITGDIVLVTINYRLGILGFINFEDPSLNIPGNNGLKDIVQALHWVQKNVHIFNGDAGNVTIFGHSSGAAAVHLLMLSPMGNGLFHRAIMQSGCALNPYVYGSRSSCIIAKAMNIEVEDENEILQKLLDIPASEFLKAQDNIPDSIDANHVRAYGFVIEKPCKEPNILTSHPMEVLLSGEYTKVPLLIGYTNKEGIFHEIKQRFKTGGFKLFTDFETKIPAYFQVPKGSDLSKRIAQRIKEFYFQGENPTMKNINGLYLFETDSVFYRGIHVTLKHHLKHATFPTYFYRFSAETKLNWCKKLGKIGHPGVSHLDELGYLFKASFVPNFKEDSVENMMVQRMVKLWTNFAKTGNPNPADEDPLIDTIWKPAKAGEHNFLDINEKLTLGVNPEQERMVFWDEISDMCPGAKNM